MHKCDKLLVYYLRTPYALHRGIAAGPVPSCGACAGNQDCRTPLFEKGGGGKLRAGIRHPAEKATPKRPSEKAMIG
jgi:hypothetical protein